MAEPAPPTGQRCPAWLLPLFTAAVLLLFLGSRGLNEPDEGRYSEIAREMAASGDWLVPHLNGFGHFQKPPLLYWLTATSLRVFGLNEWGVRMPSALAAAGIVWLVFVTARMLFNRAVAVTAALVLLAGLEFFVLARMLTPDMTLSFWTTAAVACLVRAAHGERRRVWVWAFFLAQGMGFLTKGPLALVVPCAAALGWQLAARRRPGQVKLPWLRGLLLALVIGLAWFAVVAAKFPALLDYFVGDELVKRFASKSHGRSKPFWFFVPVLLGGWLPWTCFLPALVLAAWRRWRSAEPLRPWQGMLLGWTVIPFVVLSLSGSKLLTYVLPLFPPLALALAAWWHRDAGGGHAVRGAGSAAGLLALLAVAVGGLRLLRPEVLLPGWLPFLLLGTAALVAWAVWRFRGQPAVLDILAAGAAVFWLVAATQMDALAPVLGRQATVKELAKVAREFAGPDGAMFSYAVRACGFGFYTQRLIGIRATEADIVLPPTLEQQKRLIGTPADCLRLAPGKPVCGIILADRLGSVFPTNDWQVLGRAGSFLLIGNRP